MVQQEWSARIISARQTGQSTDPMEVDITCKDGSLRRAQTSASVCSDRLLIVFNDFTERTRLENELRHAQKLEVVGQLAGGVAHDFNNIIQGVLGFIGLSQDPTLSNTDRELFLREAMSAAKRASQLTRQLLAFGRRQAMHMEDTQLPDLIANLLKLLRRLIGEHIDVQFTSGAEVGNVFCDRTQIEQVLINLCVNARDAMPRGGRIGIRIENCSLSAAFKRSNPWARIGRFVMLTVTDTGCGMDKLTQERVFEPFFTTKPKDKGSGLGLAVVYGIVRQHEGMIRLQSEVGQGTTFRIYIPVSDPQGKAAAAAAQGGAAPALGGSETILIAEDDDTIRSLIRRILERAGYQVISASNGEEAVALYETHRARIALLVFDAVMPKLSGFEAFERIRQNNPGQPVPVVFASGYNDIFSQGASLPKDAVFIQKPYDPDELLRRIRLILGQPAARPA
jgi:signal transduction histidine kinase/CheY-like chemotaxis protein